MPDVRPQVLELVTCEKVGTPRQPSMRHLVFEEMLDFLASGPSSEQIITHKVSVPVQERLRELLDKNREEGLTDNENTELDAFEFVDDLMSLLKARAHLITKA